MTKELVAQMTDHELEEAIIAKEHKLRELFPTEWFEPNLSNIGLKIAFGFKLNGLDWRSEVEFARICMAMQKLKIIEVAPDLKKIRRASHIINQH